MAKTYVSIYRDFDMTMSVAEDTKDLTPLVDRDCVRASIFRIISLSKLTYNPSKAIITPIINLIKL